jgi:hypothetical protein
MISIKDYFRYVISRLRHNNAKCYVIVDGTDNSVTFSDELYKHIDKLIVDSDYVMAFYVPRTKRYAFTINPPGLKPEDTALSQVQLNTKYCCVGFEMLVPSVNRLCYDYGIASDRKVKLSVELRCNIHSGLVYYEIQRPNYGTTQNLREHTHA